MKSKYFENEEALDQILVDYKDLFELLEDISQQLLQGIVTTADQYKEILNQTTGAFGTLQPLYSLAIAYKENSELRYYVEKKRELENKGEKIVATSLDKEASLAVANFRRIRAILEGYVLSSEKIIITAQTQLKQLSQDYKYKPQEEL